MTDRDEIIRRETFETIRQSAHAKADVLKREDINAALVKFIGGYDLYVVFWADGEVERALVIRASSAEGDLRGNAALVEDSATAIALHAACRAGDNFAPVLPASLDGGAQRSH